MKYAELEQLFFVWARQAGHGFADHERMARETYVLEKLGEAYRAGQAAIIDELEFPTGLEIEDIAKNWQRCDAEHRHAQHFYEGALWMRTLIQDQFHDQ